MTTSFLYFDGSCEPNPDGVATWGYVYVTSEGAKMKDCDVIGEGEGMTNNVAEWTALLKGLEAFSSAFVRGDRFIIRGDSNLVINQAKGEWAVRAQNLLPMAKTVQRIVSDLQGSGVDVAFQWIARENNTEADELARKAFSDYNKSHGDIYESCKCGGVFVLREGKKGKFYGCSKYPECKETRPYKPTCKTCDKFEPGVDKHRFCKSTDPNDSCERHPERRAVDWVEKYCNRHRRNMIKTRTKSEEKGIYILTTMWICPDCIREKSDDDEKDNYK